MKNKPLDARQLREDARAAFEAEGEKIAAGIRANDANLIDNTAAPWANDWATKADLENEDILMGDQ
jgi:hypothetical protein